MSAFGLKCQRLQVGDVCISLKPREIKVEPPLSPQVVQKRSMQHIQQQQQQQQQQLYHQKIKEHQQHQQQQHQQQQLDAMPQNLSRRSSGSDNSALSPMSQYSPALYSLQMSLFAAASQGRIPASYAPFMSEDTGSHMSHELNTSLNNNNSSEKLPKLTQDDYAEDLQSRKRRWSAPDVDEEQQQQQQQQSRKIVN
jgi:hypothetical protein